MSDVFVEQIVERKPDAKANLIKIGIALAAILLPSTVLFFGVLRFIFPVTLGLCCWGAFLMIRKQNVEYEYSFTNGELDVDKILGRRMRRHVLSVRVRQFDILAPMTGEYRDEYEARTIQRTEDASTSPKSPDRWFARFTDDAGAVTLLIFEPNERMREAMKGLIPHKYRGPDTAL
ncbi:MAG: DUF6106 family protein [Oscillospiraceae bacterium]|jgi:hypothetical protein|nr:DUF6106 family protein [Oscillospiraceae bacterium]